MVRRVRDPGVGPSSGGRDSLDLPDVIERSVSDAQWKERHTPARKFDEPKQITVPMSFEEWKLLRDKAIEEKRSKAEILRDALRPFFDELRDKAA